MALKDLVAQKAALTEEAIEGLIADYIRYDIDEKDVAFTPAAAGLSNKAKVLTYLVALQGWPFVTEEAIPTASKPAHIEQRVGIPGGSLRPLLKDLKDRHLVIVKDGAYSVRPSSLHAIQLELEEGPAAQLKPRRKKKRTASARITGDDNDGDDEIIDTPDTDAEAEAHDQTKGNSKSDKKPRRATAKNGGAAAAFEKWLTGGFFKEGRTLSDVERRFHKEAIIIPRTSIPTYLLKAVRAERLEREKADVAGKSVWVYVEPKK